MDTNTHEEEEENSAVRRMILQSIAL